MMQHDTSHDTLAEMEQAQLALLFIDQPIQFAYEIDIECFKFIVGASY